jgi:8-oxo-dGTP pyrophosphatase MutT (NUDIX family)
MALLGPPQKTLTSTSFYNLNPFGSSKTWFPAGSILPNDAPVDGGARELFEETGLTLIVDDLTLLSSNHVQVPLPVAQHQLVHVFSASVHVPYVTPTLRTHAKVELVVAA